MVDWPDMLATCHRTAEPHVLITVIETLGSTPREGGAKMVVSATAQAGSIGGGNLELEATRHAREMLAEGAHAPVIEKVHLGADLLQCCGGGLSLLYEPFFAAGFPVVLFGAGHVGQALITCLRGTRARIRWVDSRPGWLPETPPPGVICTPTDDPAEIDVPTGAYCLVMTHSHALDLAIIRALMGRDDLAYLGLIGSKSKWARFQNRLRKDGVDPALFSRVHCPIGMRDLPGKRPSEIAISVAADLLRRVAATPPQPA